MVLMQKDMDAKDKRKMLEEIDEVDGVKWSLGMNTLFGPTIPESMIPDDMKKMLQSDNYELAFICSEYESATDEVNKQISEIDKIVKSYSKHAMVIGEAPLMKDLQDTTDVDLKTVNAISILAIFIIIMIVFKSISFRSSLWRLLSSQSLSIWQFHITRNEPSVCGKYCHRYYSAWSNCGLCDLDDEPLSERTWKRKR